MNIDSLEPLELTIYILVINLSSNFIFIFEF